MDVNGTRYHLLLGTRDWQRQVEGSTVEQKERLEWDARRGHLALRRQLFRFPARSAEPRLTPADRRGAGRDRFGHVYWISEDRTTVRYRPAGARKSGLLWSVTELTAPPCGTVHATADFRPAPAAESPTAGELPTLSGLAVTERHYLVVGTLAPGGLLIFDLHGGGPPVWRLWPEEVPFAPFDLAPAPGGGLWVLDRPTAGARRLWRLDRDLRVVRTGLDVEVEEAWTSDFRPLLESGSGKGTAPSRPARTFPTGISLPLSLEWASPLETFDATAVTALPDGSVLLLEPDPIVGDTFVHRLGAGILPSTAALGPLLADLFEEKAELVGHDFAFLPDADLPAGEVTGTLFVASSEGNQSFAFALTADVLGQFALEALDTYLPMRRFAGKALIEGAVMEGGGDAYYDLADGWLALTEVPRPRFDLEGTLDRLVFDGKKPGCVWHRLLLDAAIPRGDTVTVESRTADEERLLEQAEWQTEPPPGFRPGGPELPWTPAFAAGGTAADGAGTWELLFQNATGRYLELRLRFSGSGRSSPQLAALRVHYPRFSYLEHYLPATYREEPASASFLDRLLANFEGVFTELEGRIAGVETLFDSRTVPAETLDWLAGWLAALLDPDWDEARRRLFLAHAVELYRRRGTPRGVIEAVRLAIDECPDGSLFADGAGDGDQTPFSVRLVEGFRTRLLPGVLLGDPTAPTGPALLDATETWQPAHGGARLDQLWRQFLSTRYDVDASGLGALNAAWGRSGTDEVTTLRSLVFPPLTPSNAAEAADRRSFIERTLGLPYADVGTDDAPAWRGYLSRLYGRVAVLADAWGRVGRTRPTSFAQLDVPSDRLPPDGAPLVDWFRFTTLALPIARTAHRFTVLVPVGADFSPAERLRRLGRVRDVVERSRPAHTLFETRLYWALFRAGEARVGRDTLLGEGSRLTAITLGAGYLGQGLLAAEHPATVTDRRVAGRDTVGNPPPLN